MICEGAEAIIWRETFYARDFAIIGRLTSKAPHGDIVEQELLIATVNPNMPEGAYVAASIAEVLNTQFATEKPNVRI